MARPADHVGPRRRHAGPGVRRASRGKTFAVHIQDPQIPPRLLDLVVVPQHDKLRGPNVITTRGALHMVTPAKLADAAARMGPAYGHLPHPRIAVLIGGTNKLFRMTPVIMATWRRSWPTSPSATAPGCW